MTDGDERFAGSLLKVLREALWPARGLRKATLPQINMEAHRGPDIEDSSPKKGPLSTSVLIWRSVGACPSFGGSREPFRSKK